MKKCKLLAFLFLLTAGAVCGGGPEPAVIVGSSGISDGSVTTAKIAAGYNLLTTAEKTQALTGSSTVDFAAKDITGASLALTGTAKATFLLIASTTQEVIAGWDASGFYYASGFGWNHSLPLYMGTAGSRIVTGGLIDDTVSKLQVNGSVKLAPTASVGAVAGAIYFDSDDNHFYGYDGSTWKQLDN